MCVRIQWNSDNGHSEERTTSLLWTNCLPHCTFLPPKKGQPLNNGHNIIQNGGLGTYPPVHLQKVVYLLQCSVYLAVRSHETEEWNERERERDSSKCSQHSKT